MAETDIHLLGLPSDEASTFMRGAALGPQALRRALRSDSTNLASERGTEIREGESYIDLGDLDLPAHEGPDEGTRRQIEEMTDRVLEQPGRLVAVGGDHAITYPILRSYGRHMRDLTVLHIDAHPDLWDEIDGLGFGTNRFSHASPFSRALEEDCMQRLVQIGIRTINTHQRAQADEFSVEVHEMSDASVEELCQEVLPTLRSPLYLSLDLDALDPAFAPGVSHHEPGGLSTREVLRLIQAIPVPLVGADIVELNPRRDEAGVTARVAAKLFKEIVAQMAGRLESG